MTGQALKLLELIKEEGDFDFMKIPSGEAKIKKIAAPGLIPLRPAENEQNEEEEVEPSLPPIEVE